LRGYTNHLHAIGAFVVLFTIFSIVSLRGNQYVIPGLAMSKVYSNSMLALLNSRAKILNGRGLELETQWHTIEHSQTLTRNTSPQENSAASVGTNAGPIELVD
jgi:hypothetical protein